MDMEGKSLLESQFHLRKPKVFMWTKSGKLCSQLILSRNNYHLHQTDPNLRILQMMCITCVMQCLFFHCFLVAHTNTVRRSRLEDTNQQTWRAHLAADHSVATHRRF